MKLTITEQAKELAERTSDAYSCARYGNQWVKCAQWLLDQGYTAEEAEWCLRSKFMRWAADMGEKRYGPATAQMLADFLSDSRQGDGIRETMQKERAYA